MPRRDVALIIAIGLDDCTFHQAINQTASAEPNAPLQLFLTDQIDFHPLTEKNYLFEHFPSTTSQSMVGGNLPWERYALRRLDLLVLKWRPISIVPLGKRSLEILSSWRDHNARRYPVQSW
ncbi:MAG: hypothetical protein ACR2RF_01325 [Geminicoccaceae bacterium]